CGGWCLPGRRCETGRIPGRYPVREVEAGDYNERTHRNIQDADATLVVTQGGFMEEGTALTLSWCEEYGQPVFHWDISDPGLINLPDLAELSGWIQNHEIEVLNVAGNRESNSPGIQVYTVTLLEMLFFPQVGDE
ncbi:MAG: putative molybdenum carrier protein, partial [Bacteroidales bacterium]